MSTQIHAATRLKASTWWDSLTDEQKEGYIEEHPTSKYAKEAKKAKKALEQPKPKMKTISEALKKAFSRAPEADREFYEKGGHVAKSAARRSASKVIKDKSVGILDHLKMQKDEWKAGINAVRKLSKKQELSHHDKEALKACAKDLVYTVAATALTGGLTHGVVTALSHMGMHMFTDMSLKAFSSSMVTAAEDTEPTDKLMSSLVTQMADMFENADIPEDLLARSIK